MSNDAFQGIGQYDRGFTVHRALAADPRFSYSLYAPESAFEPGSKPRLIVSVHGTGRSYSDTLHQLSTFGRWHNCIVMCPLFPANVLGDGNLHGYKYLLEQQIRYDLVLNAMVDEVAARYRTAFDKFALIGFSGGGHFVHRYLMLHPERLWAASIGAPGSITLPDDSQDWWIGTRNLQALFGKDIDLAALRQVPIHMAVGAVDLETAEITHQPGGKYWMPGANDAGETRPQRLETLRRAFEANAIPASLTIMAGAAHDERRYNDTVQGFLAQVIATLDR